MPDEFINPNLNNGLEHRVGADLHDWEYNDTIDRDDIAVNVRKCINSLYTTSIANQKADCNIKRVGGKMSDFVRDTNANAHYGLSYTSYALKYPIKNTFFFNKLFLQRLNRRSVGRRKYFSADKISVIPRPPMECFNITDTPNRHDVFTHRLLMFINGEMFTDLVLYATSEYLLMVIDADRDGTNLRTIEELCSENSKARWSLVGIPFTKSMSYTGPVTSLGTDNQFHDIFEINDTECTINARMLKVDADYRITKNFWLIAMAGDTTIKTVDTTNESITDNIGYMYVDFGSIGDNGTISTEALLPCAKKIFTDSPKTANIRLINIPNVMGWINIGTSRIFQLAFDKDHTSPVPPDNMIVFKKTDMGYKLVHMYDDNDNQRIVKQYFPNVYNLTGFNASDELRVLIFYGEHDKTTFSNPIASYMSYNANYANDIVAGVVPEAIKSYLPAINEYFEYNYLEYHADATRHIEHEYKLETLRELAYDDPSRLTNIYMDHLQKANMKFHSNPKFIIDMKENKLKSDDDPTKLKVEEIVEAERTRYVYNLVINHQDDRMYPVSIWVDGKHLNADDVTVISRTFKTAITINADSITDDSIIIVEMMKVNNSGAFASELDLPPIHNSFKLPKGLWKDISPQNMMIGIRKEIPGENDTVTVKYQLASNYEMYWLIMGHIQYKNGVPINYQLKNYASIDSVNIVMDNQDNTLLQDDNVAVIADHEDEFLGDVDILRDLGDETYHKVRNEEYNDDFTLMRRLGYYGGDRRRFYAYMPHGPLDPDIFITPITDYFANAHIMMQNTDIYFARKLSFETDSNGNISSKILTISNFMYDPTPSKFRIFIDGLLLDYSIDYDIDVYQDRGWFIGSDLAINIRKEIDMTKHHDITFEYLPYKYRYLYRNAAEYDGNILLTDEFTRPFNTAFYDVYLDGRLLSDKDITYISNRRFIINEVSQDVLANGAKTPRTVSIYERAHDPDVIDYVWRWHEQTYKDGDGNDKTALVREMKPIRDGILDQIINSDSKFKKSLLPTWDPKIDQKESAAGLGIGNSVSADDNK